MLSTLFRRRTLPPDYYGEALALREAGKYRDALISFRLALRREPEDGNILVQIAITYGRLGMVREARQMYHEAVNRGVAGGHYGLAFLDIRDGRTTEAVGHLRAFLANAPRDERAKRHVAYARSTLVSLVKQNGASSMDRAKAIS